MRLLTVHLQINATGELHGITFNSHDTINNTKVVDKLKETPYNLMKSNSQCYILKTQ